MRASEVFKAISRTFVRYLALLLGSTAVFCALLYVAGLGGDTVRQRVIYHIKSSIEQISQEGLYPRPFDSGDPSNQLYNFTDITILQGAIYLNTEEDWTCIFMNPRYMGSYPEDFQGNTRIQSLTDATDGAEPNDCYYRYWQGFRVYVRPLLIFMDYASIRGFAALIFLLLFVAAVITVYCFSGLAACAGLTLSVALMNVPVLSSSLQFIPCFCIAFLSVILLPHILARMPRVHITSVFFLIGAATQFFDFYTSPVITLVIPLLFVVSMEQPGRKSAALAARCLPAWALGYGLLWIMRLTLVSLVSGSNAYVSVFSSFAMWTGLAADEVHAHITFAGTMSSVMSMLLLPKYKYFLFALLLFLLAVLIVRAARRELQTPRFIFLALAALPVLWLMAAYKASGTHYWFQYRMLAGSLYGCLLFYASLFRPRDSARRPRVSGQ